MMSKKEIIYCVCLTCGVRNSKENTETSKSGECINGHDDWLEFMDFDHVLTLERACKKFGLGLSELYTKFQENGDMLDGVRVNIKIPKTPYPKCELNYRKLSIGNLMHLQTLDNNCEFVDLVITLDSRTLADAERYKDDWTGAPIKLDDDWLDILGATNEPEKNSFQVELKSIPGKLSYFFVIFNGHSYSVLLPGKYHGSRDPITMFTEILYVHELQQIYSVLSTKELIIDFHKLKTLKGL